MGLLDVILKKKTITRKVNTLADVIKFDEFGRVGHIDWEKFISLQILSNDSDNRLCVKAYKNLGECISLLSDGKKRILLKYKSGGFSIYTYGKADERIDPHYDGEFYSFGKLEYAQQYLDELRQYTKRKLYIKDWPKVHLETTCIPYE